MHANEQFPMGEIHKSYKFQGNVWISPGEKFKFACMFGFLPGRNPNIHANEQFPMAEIHESSKFPGTVWIFFPGRHSNLFV